MNSEEKRLIRQLGEYLHDLQNSVHDVSEQWDSFWLNSLSPPSNMSSQKKRSSQPKVSSQKKGKAAPQEESKSVALKPKKDRSRRLMRLGSSADEEEEEPQHVFLEDEEISEPDIIPKPTLNVMSNAQHMSASGPARLIRSQTKL